MSGGADCNCDLCTAQRTGDYSAFGKLTTSGDAQRRPLSPAERAMRIVWKVQLSEDTRQRKLAMRPDAKDRVAAAEAKREQRKQRRLRVTGDSWGEAMEQWLQKIRT